MGLSEKLVDIKNQTDALLTFANQTTGESDTRLGEAVRRLTSGYGGGGGSGMNVEGCYAYGRCVAPHNITARGVPFYFSVPEKATLTVKRQEITRSKPPRPVYNSTINITGIAKDGAYQTISASESVIIPNNGNVSVYSQNATTTGVSHEQSVLSIGLPSQGVSTPSDGYIFEFCVIIPKIQTSTLEFYDDHINLGDVQPDTWIPLGDHGYLYLGWTNPIQ